MIIVIGKEELLETANFEQPYQKEKDYIEELFLAEIYEEADELVFKGGTAMSKFYGSTRFSDDLDFSVVPKKESAPTCLRKAQPDNKKGVEGLSCKGAKKVALTRGDHVRT